MLRVFRSKPKYATVRSTSKDESHAGDPLWTRCETCGSLIYHKELVKNWYVCQCGYHFRISAADRLRLLVDQGSFQPAEPLVSLNPLGFPGYEEKIAQSQEKLELDDAILIGEAKIQGHSCVLGIIDFSFIGGSMGSVVGEQITRGFEYGAAKQLPVVIISGGGAEPLQEGIFSLMQMAKTAQAVGRFKRPVCFICPCLLIPLWAAFTPVLLVW